MTDFLPAGVITEHPELAAPRVKGRGYPWQPFDAVPQDFFRGASGLGNVLGKPWLVPWVAKLTAQVAGDMRKELATLDKRNATRLVKNAAKDARYEPMERGSALHDYAANQLAATAGLPFRHVELEDAVDRHAANLTDWIDRHVASVVAIERTLYLPELRVAGTIDAIVHTRGGQTVAIDWKTKVGKGLHEIKPDLDHALQAWALGNATHIAIPEQQQLHDLPPLDGFLLVYIADDGHLTHPVDIRSGPLADLCTHAARLLDLADVIGTSVFGPPVRHLTDQTSAPTQVAAPPVTA